MELSTFEWGVAIAAVVAAAGALALRRRGRDDASRDDAPEPPAQAPAPARAEPRLEPVGADGTDPVDRAAAASPPTAAPRAPAPSVAAQPAQAAMPASASDADADTAVVEAPDDTERVSTPSVPPVTTAPARVRLNPAIDCIVEMDMQAPQPGAKLLSLTRPLVRVGSKPVAFEGHELTSGEWEPLSAAGRYGALRAGLLLANRAGALTAMEFSAFAAALQPLAEPLGALVDLPDMGAVTERAQDVDALCAELDAQVGLTIDREQPPSGAELRLCAETCGLVPRGEGRWVKEAEGGGELFSMSVDPAGRVGLVLDVPRARADRQPWRQMVDCAIQCAAQLKGRIVDDTGRRVDLPSLERIEGDLESRWIALERAGFPAGSPDALRLFA